MSIDELIVLAAAEGWRIRPPTLRAKPICINGETVGFFCPHPAGRGRTRVGPIYVHPAYRGRRLAEQAYEQRVPFVAYTHADNVASERLHERCGFTRWYQTRGGWYWRRDAA